MSSLVNFTKTKVLTFPNNTPVTLYYTFPMWEKAGIRIVRMFTSCEKYFTICELLYSPLKKIDV